MSLSKYSALKLSFVLQKVFQGIRKRKRIYHHSFRKSNPKRSTTIIGKKYTDLSNERSFCINSLSTCLLNNEFGKRTNRSLWDDACNFSCTKWLKYFRMNKKTFKLLVTKLTPSLKSSTTRKLINIEKEIAIALVFLSSGKNYTSIAHLFDVLNCDVSCAVKNVCNAILKVLMPQYLKVLNSCSLTECVERFDIMFDLPQCAGVLNSIHIPVDSKTVSNSARDYINKIGDYSVVLQGIVDSSYKFWDINVGWPGSVAESKVLTSSALWKKGQGGNLFPHIVRCINDVEVPLFVLAGQQYPLSHWMLKPFFQNGHMKEDQKIFNKKLEMANNISNIAFKRLVSRWRCLKTGNINLDILPTVVASCCILHNMCESLNEPVLSIWDKKTTDNFQQPQPDKCFTVMGHKAESIRYALMNYVA